MVWSMVVAILATVSAWALARGGSPARSGPLPGLARQVAPVNVIAPKVATSIPALASKPQPADAKRFLTREVVSKPPGNTAAIIGHPQAPVALEPGVYKTEPFACIVVVPEPQLDDALVIQPPAGRFSMRIVAPDLRFVPVNPARK
jgi:hypothetical protein